MEVQLPVAPGTRVEVIVLAAPAEDTFADLTDAAQSSTAFWDNPEDDRDWNRG